MASISKRRNGDGSISWDALVRVVGYPATGKSFRTKLEAELWAARIEAAAKGRTLILSRDMTLADLIDAPRDKLKEPASAALGYWRERIGMFRLIDVNSALIARHRDLLLGAQCRSHGHKRAKPRSAATVRKYLIALSSVYRVGMRDLRVCDTNPVALVSKPPEGQWRTRFLSDDELKRLLDAADALAEGWVPDDALTLIDEHTENPDELIEPPERIEYEFADAIGDAGAEADELVHRRVPDAPSKRAAPPATIAESLVGNMRQSSTRCSDGSTGNHRL